jgi:hypothetical protein
LTLELLPLLWLLLAGELLRPLKLLLQQLAVVGVRLRLRLRLLSLSLLMVVGVRLLLRRLLHLVAGFLVGELSKLERTASALLFRKD